MSNGYNLNYKNYIPQKSNTNYSIVFLFLILIIGLGSLVGWYYYTDSNISDCSDYYKQQTGKDWSDCKDPGGKQNASSCSCDCNPGYEGINCQTKSKHVSDLETACKDKTGSTCVSCLKGWITKNLSGSGTDVQDFKDDFNKNIISINNFCCQKNCSNASATVCDKCVSEGMTNLSTINQKLNTNDKTYLINSSGCFSIINELQKESNDIGKTNICSDSGSDSGQLPSCPLSAGQVNKCSDVNNQSVQEFKDRWDMCDNLLSNEKEICTVNSQKTSCISSKTKCIHPKDPDGKLYGSDKCNFNGFYDSNKCQCPGMTNPNGWVGGGGSDISWYDQRQGKYHGPIIFYADDNSKCKTTCKQQGNPTKKLVKNCPCGISSPDCGNNLKCSGETRSNSAGRKCQ
jgi:hypothetical protein